MGNNKIGILFFGLMCMCMSLLKRNGRDGERKTFASNFNKSRWIRVLSKYVCAYTHIWNSSKKRFPMLCKWWIMSIGISIVRKTTTKMPRKYTQDVDKSTVNTFYIYSLLHAVVLSYSSHTKTSMQTHTHTHIHLSICDVIHSLTHSLTTTPLSISASVSPSRSISHLHPNTPTAPNTCKYFLYSHSILNEIVSDGKNQTMTTHKRKTVRKIYKSKITII